MRHAALFVWLLCLPVLPSGSAPAQESGGFTLEASASVAVRGTPYFDRIDSLYQFTPHELALLGKHGFVVSERLKRQSIGSTYDEAYHADLPVFVTTDAILHAFHKSYNNILQAVEEQLLLRILDSLLTRLHGSVPGLAQRYAAQPGMNIPLRDVDFYLAVASGTYLYTLRGGASSETRKLIVLR
jgi:hypothetical protein